jgi:putative spermidine/putrescine transport system substrate-binding protein
MKRRTFITGIAGATAAATFGLPLPAFAQSRPFTFTSWGGALSEAEKNAFLDPFAASKGGLEIIHTSPTETARIKAMVEANSVEWDLVTVGGSTAYEGGSQGFLQELDYSLIPNADLLEPTFRSAHGVGTSTGATIIAWSKSHFPDGGPESWADFWDVDRFPGPRGLYNNMLYNYEAALLAAGVSRDEVFPYTREKGEMALAKIAELKPHISVFWSSGAQPPQLLSSGELAMSSAWNGRILAAEMEGAPVGYTYNDGIAWANWWVIPKGSPYTDLAHEAMNFALDPKNQLNMLELKTYGPVLTSATETADAETQRVLVMTEENIRNMVILDEEGADQYTQDFLEEWNQLKLG